MPGAYHFFSLSPTMKTDQKSPYTPNKFTYTIGDQIRFQISLNGSNLYTKLWKICGKKWCYRNEKMQLLFIIENTIRVFLVFWKVVGCPSKNTRCPKQLPLSNSTTHDVVGSIWTSALTLILVLGGMTRFTFGLPIRPITIISCRLIFFWIN